MSWPASPLATFVNGNAPACDDTFLNNLQAGVNELCLGTQTHAAVVVDGAGGVAATPVSGTAKVSANIISTTTPNPALAPGTLYKDLVPFAGGYITNAAGVVAIACGFGISSVAHVAVGIVDVTLLNTMASTSKCFVTATLDGSGWAFWYVGNTTTTKIRIGSKNSTGADADIGFTFILYATAV